MNDLSICGRSLASGIATGELYFLKKAPLLHERRKLTPDEVPNEIDRFITCSQTAIAELTRFSQILETDQRSTELKLIETHIQLLIDPLGICKLVVDAISEQGVCVELALNSVLKQLKTQFRVIEDEVLSERYSDIEDVGTRLLDHLKPFAERHTTKIPKGSVLIADHISFSDALNAVSDVVAFVATNGSSFSHTAILARARSIPYVVDVDISKIKNSRKVTVDGDRGCVIVNPTQTLASASSYSAFSNEDVQQSSTELAGTLKLLANIEHPNDLQNALACNLNEVGLLRTEYLFAENRIRASLPIEQEQVRLLRQCNRPGFKRVVIRVLDMSSEKFPLLYRGLRGVQFLLKEPEFFKGHLRAIVESFPQGCSVLLPFVSNAYEVAKASKIFDGVLQDVYGSRKPGVFEPGFFELGAMIESPQGVLEVDDILQEADFISIGSNDLIQYSLGIDRSTTDLSNTNFTGLNGLHEGVLELLSIVITAANQASKACTLCGEIAADEHVLPQLIALGLQRISLSPKKVAHVRSLLNAMAPDGLERLRRLRQMQPHVVTR